MLALTSAGVAALATTTVVVAFDRGEADEASRRHGAALDAGRTGPEVLARHPLSGRAVERRLEERFVPPHDDDRPTARCSALQPRPAHAIRWCRIHYAGGSERTVIVLSNPQGYELLVERPSGPRR
jgi:hypothetical protein